MQKRKKFFTISIFFFEVVCSIFFWLEFDQVIQGQSPNGVIALASLLVLMATIYLMASVIVKKYWLMSVFIFLMMTPSLCVAFNYAHIAIMFLAGILMLLSSWLVKREMRFETKIRFWKIFKAGRIIFVAAMSLIIASVYFFEIKNMNGMAQISRLKTQKISSALAPKILSLVYSDFEKQENKDISVDQFILDAQQGEIASASKISLNDDDVDQIITNNFGANISPLEKESYKKIILKNIDDLNKKSVINKNFILQQGRKQLSENLDMNLAGSEKMSDVLSLRLEKEFDNWLLPMTDDSSGLAMLPFSMAIIVFLTLFSAGVFLSIVWAFLASIILIICEKMQVISIEKIDSQVEIIR